MAREESSSAPESVPAEHSSPDAPTMTTSKPKSSAVLAVLALILGAVALIFALIPFVVFAAPLFGLSGLILAIIALVKKSGPVAVRILALVVSVIAAPLAIVGILGTVALVPPTLDSAVVENEVENKILENYAMTATVKCPEEMSGWPGDTFECDVTAQSGNTGSVLITINEDDTWSVNIENSNFFTVLDVADVQNQITTDIWNDYGVEFAVTCPTDMFGGVDTIFTCDATYEGQTVAVEVKITGGSSEDWVWHEVG